MIAGRKDVIDGELLDDGTVELKPRAAHKIREICGTFCRTMRTPRQAAHRQPLRPNMAAACDPERDSGQ